MHKIDYALHVGPSISVNPWNKLIATAYFHVMPTASSIIQNDNFSYGFGCMMAAGVSPKWLDVNAAELTAKVVALPEREDIDYPVEEHLIVEFYSK